MSIGAVAAILIALPVAGDYPTIGVDKARFKELKENLINNNARVQWEAAQALGQIAEELEACVGRLQTQLQNDNPKVRFEAATALSRMGPLGKSAIVTLRKLLKIEQIPDVKTKMIHALVSMRPFSKDAVPDLIEHAKHKDRNVRMAAVCGLGGYEAESKIAVPVLIEAINDPDVAPNERETCISHAALLALRSIGPHAMEASSVFFKLANGDKLDLARIAIPALAKIDPRNPKLVPFYLELLADQQRPALRQSAANGLAQLGPDSHEAIPALLLALERDDYPTASEANHTRAAIIQALGNMGSLAIEALPTIRNYEKNGTGLVNLAARIAVQKITQKEQ
ncbi:MAG: HEAT repeat domain-containing protein [Gemmataceae bacterium]|nr:HEAT repeat domain-containing protein [Gemmataceae bacterium]MCI0739933.1 HEAT repeat domain-containing protein [Gemmataceae bacterium]